MKRDTLKLKAALVALSLTCATHQPAHGMNSGNQIQIEYLDENQFFEVMIFRIKNEAVDAIIKLIERFINPKNTESFDQYIFACKTTLVHIENAILIPLRNKLELVKATQPGSSFHIILEKTYKLAQEMVYAELKNLITILETHRASKDAKKATALAGKLKPTLLKLTSIATLNLLDQKCMEICNLLPATTSPAIRTETDNLKKLIAEMKAKAAATQKAVDMELLVIINKMLNRI